MRRARSLFRDNGLAIVLLALFFSSLAGQIAAGFADYNNEQEEHRQTPVSMAKYLTSGAFVEATFENWESEFLQMALYVWLTSFLVQRGSAESKDPDAKEEADEDPKLHRLNPMAPLPVRRGGWVLRLYEYSLVIALFSLFAISFWLHLLGSTRESCRGAMQHGEPCVTAAQQILSATFWFESLQNWQSEFVSIAALVVLSIFLRQRGSPESKPVHAPHSATGK